MSNVGLDGHEIPDATHATKNEGSPAGGTLSKPAVHVAVTVLDSDPTLSDTESNVGADAG